MNMSSCCHSDQKARLQKADGQIKAIIKMIDEEKPCEQILMQLSAVESAIRSASRQILKDHMNHCVVTSIQKGDTEIIEGLNKILDTYLKK